MNIIGTPRRVTKEEKKERRLRISTYIGIIIAILGLCIGLGSYVSELRSLQSGLETILRELKAKEANANINLIEEQLGIPIYVDGLPSAPPQVFDPFAKGLKLMKEKRESKWYEAIVQFQKAMKEARASQLVGLYNLIGLCYYTMGKLDLAWENYDNSLGLAVDVNDKLGEATARDNLGLIYQNKGDLDMALKFHKRALKIHREIGNRVDEATALNNVGLIYMTKGDLDKALDYQKEALKITRRIGNRVNEANILSNLGLLFQTRGEKAEALKHYEEALRIFTQIGAQREIGTIKENLKRLKGE